MARCSKRNRASGLFAYVLNSREVCEEMMEQILGANPSETGESRVIAAVIEQALWDAHLRPTKQTKEYETRCRWTDEAREWLLGRDDGGEWTFSWCCLMLGWNATALRGRMIANLTRHGVLVASPTLDIRHLRHEQGVLRAWRATRR